MCARTRGWAPIDPSDLSELETEWCDNREDATATSGWRAFIPATGALDNRHLQLYSINAAWQANLTMARNALFHGRVVGLVGKGLDIPARVRAILHGAPIEACLTRGSKVRNFQRSMLLQDSCTNDRWSFRAFNRPAQDTGQQAVPNTPR
jgi:hypothetical protein